jgi:hypothetical protein
MKSLRVSLAVAMALSGSAYAVDLANIKVSGQATLYYQTMENNPQAPWYAIGGTADKTIDDDKGLFHKDASLANVGLSVNFSADLGYDFSFGARLNVLETLGLEHNLVSGTMQSIKGSADNDNLNVRTSITGTGSANLKDTGLMADDEWYWGEAYLVKKMGSSLIKAGRQSLDTPLVYSEDWNVLPNTFDAVVAVNQAVPNLTLIGAYVSKGNSHKTLGQFNTLAGGLAVDGAYAVAGVYGVGQLKAQAWYYTVPTVADAFWADVNTDLNGVKLTAQLASFMWDSELQKALKTATQEADDTMAYALRVSYKVAPTTNLCVAISQTTGDQKSHNIANVGTGVKTKLVTATISGDGDVAGATDTTSMKFTLIQGFGNANEFGSASLSYAQYQHGEDSTSSFKDETASVIEAVYKHKYLGVDMLAAYIYDKNVNGWTVKKVGETESEAASTVRVVARYNF